MNYKDFNAIVYTGNPSIGNNGYVKYRKQTSQTRFEKFISEKYPDWKFYNMYDRNTNEMETIKRK
ncbi:MAG: hypothetical protein U0U66_03755 [Cytophagaceae bacterium]|jgi:hypothetical protein